MSEKNLQPVRGTHDLIGADCRRYQFIRDLSYGLAYPYGYQPIATPIFEYAPVFKRTIGETSDIIGKEMYSFLDRGGEEITLRPEGTAPTARAVISNGLTQSMPLKLIYDGPMFRYERPQKGRTRQFHQIGIECFGIADPLADVETIDLGVHILKQLGIFERATLEINTIGDNSSRNAYRQALVDYFTPFTNRLSPDSQMRLTRNPLRILDSKNPTDQEIVEKAPIFDDYLNTISLDFFAKVCAGLDRLKIPYARNPHLVRGLDYYCHTAFEITTTDLGTQATILAGGRYNGLVSQLGGPEIPAVGWAMGIDRVALMLKEAPSPPRPVAIIPVGDEATLTAFQLTMDLRKEGFLIEFSYSSNVGKQLKHANKINACLAILLGGDEIAASQATIRNLDTGDQNSVAFSGLKDYLNHFMYPQLR